MKNTFFLLLTLVAAFLLVSCEAGDTGNFKIRLRLPIEENNNFCGDGAGATDDTTYCIQESDQVLLSIYTSTTPSGEYVYADRKLIRVASSNGGKEEFIRSLKKGIYYRFFVEVTNANEKLKLTGGLDSILYDDAENFEVDIFLGAAGDFVRVVKDKNDYDSSLLSYFESYGSKGAAAAPLKNGKLYLSGGYSFDWEMIVSDTMVFDLKNVSSKKAAALKPGLMDHTASFLDDGSESGKVVVAFGTTEDDSYSNAILLYDPDKDKYRNIGYGDSVTRAKAITIDGDVYITGGCSGDKVSKKIYKVDKTQTVSEYATLQTGRCNHGIADVSYTKEDGTFVPRILIVGGSTDEDGEKPVTGDTFAEIVTASSKAITLTDRTDGDSVELLKKGLVSAGATSLVMDDLEIPETVVTLVGGYLMDGEEDNKAPVVSKNLYVLSEKSDGSWVYDVNTSSDGCARPSVGTIGSAEKSPAKYAAVNCGAGQTARTDKVASDQIIFVVQVKRSLDPELGVNVFGASVKDSLFKNNSDSENGVIVDGPVAVNELGQAYIFGTQFVYQVSSYALP
ncbi:MAG TPA: kelch repeat-containing protein [bacterium]|nr:kelch repeat-containing protein [bacterium]HQO91309.1 kelch repeat-containing protein [bacterium]